MHLNYWLLIGGGLFLVANATVWLVFRRRMQTNMDAVRRMHETDTRVRKPAKSIVAVAILTMSLGGLAFAAGVLLAVLSR